MKFKKLAIFSDCIHYFDEAGNVVTQNPIFCKQMQAIAGLFEKAVLYCPFDECSPGITATKYEERNISFYPLPKVGGTGLASKLKIFRVFPVWFKAYRKACKESDIIYQRFPNNLNIPGAIYFWFKKKPVFGTYTGTWDNYSNEPKTFRFQKWFLRRYFRGPAGIYSKTEPSGGKLFKSFSPSYTITEWHAESNFVNEKAARLASRRPFVPVFLTAGALVNSKNQQYILDCFLQLQQEGFDFRLYIAGDGPLKDAYALFIAKHGLGSKVFLKGMMNEQQMKALYRESDFVIQASLIEGFGKVPAEGFFYGAVPILHDVSLAAEITGNGTRGLLYHAGDVEDLSLLLRAIYLTTANILTWSMAGRAYSFSHTIERWVDIYADKIEEHFGK